MTSRLYIALSIDVRQLFPEPLQENRLTHSHFITLESQTTDFLYFGDDTQTIYSYDGACRCVAYTRNRRSHLIYSNFRCNEWFDMFHVFRSFHVSSACRVRQR